MLFYNSFGQFGSEEMVGDEKLQGNVVYIKLDNIKSNGVSGWFKKNSMRLVVRLFER